MERISLGSEKGKESRCGVGSMRRLIKAIGFTGCKMRDGGCWWLSRWAVQVGCGCGDG